MFGFAGFDALALILVSIVFLLFGFKYSGTVVGRFGAKGDMLPIVAWCWLILTLIC